MDRVDDALPRGGSKIELIFRDILAGDVASVPEPPKPRKGLPRSSTNGNDVSLSLDFGLPSSRLWCSRSTHKFSTPTAGRESGPTSL